MDAILELDSNFTLNTSLVTGGVLFVRHVVWGSKVPISLVKSFTTLKCVAGCDL